MQDGAEQGEAQTVRQADAAAGGTQRDGGVHCEIMVAGVEVCDGEEKVYDALRARTWSLCASAGKGWGEDEARHAFSDNQTGQRWRPSSLSPMRVSKEPGRSDAGRAGRLISRPDNPYDPSGLRWAGEPPRSRSAGPTSAAIRQSRLARRPTTTAAAAVAAVSPGRREPRAGSSTGHR